MAGIKYVTHEGLNKLKEELDHLMLVERKKFSNRLLRPATKEISQKMLNMTLPRMLRLCWK